MESNQDVAFSEDDDADSADNLIQLEGHGLPVDNMYEGTGTPTITFRRRHQPIQLVGLSLPMIGD